MSVEQRQHPRKALHVGAVLTVQGQQPLEVRTMNISIDGLCVSASTPVPAGAACTIYVSLPVRAGHSKQVLQLQARVVYSVFSRAQGVKIGLNFVAPPEAAVKAIDEFVKA